MSSPNLIASKEIWIDLDNTPHVPFFAPIIKDLERRGYKVIITVRDAYQTRALADFFWLQYIPVGRHYGRRRVLKVIGTCIRGIQLAVTMRRNRARLAVAHGSRSQVMAAALLGIPKLLILDYEGAGPTIFAKPDWILMPEVIPATAENQHKLLRYPGIKEDVYVPTFAPDRSIVAQLGLSDEDIIATVRPPASEAHYHNPASDELLEAALRYLSGAPKVKIVLLPRNGRQASQLRELWPDLFSRGKAIIPENAVDGLNLIWHSDFVISGGGTMNREAAALGVPVYSVFRGKIGAVDRYLAREGRLVLLENAQDVREKIVLAKRGRASAISAGDDTLQTVVNHIVSLVETGRPAHTDPPQ